MKFEENGLSFLKGVLGDSGVEELKKFEAALFKPHSNLTVSINEMVSGLQIVPRAVLSFLKEHLLPMGIDESKDITIPFKEHAVLHVEKKDTDVYTGSVLKNSRSTAQFKYRSLPGVGLTLLTALELYDMKDLDQEVKSEPNLESNLTDMQKEIDKKVKIASLVEKVKKEEISYRDAIDNLIQFSLLNQLPKELKEQLTQTKDVETFEPEDQSPDKKADVTKPEQQKPEEPEKRDEGTVKTVTKETEIPAKNLEKKPLFKKSEIKETEKKAPKFSNLFKRK